MKKQIHIYSCYVCIGVFAFCTQIFGNGALSRSVEPVWAQRQPLWISSVNVPSQSTVSGYSEPARVASTSQPSSSNAPLASISSRIQVPRENVVHQENTAGAPQIVISARILSAPPGMAQQISVKDFAQAIDAQLRVMHTENSTISNTSVEQYRNHMVNAPVSSLRTEVASLTEEISRVQAYTNNVLRQAEKMFDAIPWDTRSQLSGLSLTQILEGISNESIRGITPEQAIALKQAELVLAQCHSYLQGLMQCREYVAARLDAVRCPQEAQATISVSASGAALPLEKAYMQLADLEVKKQDLHREADHLVQYHINPLQQSINELNVEMAKRSSSSFWMGLRNGIKDGINFFKDVDERMPALQQRLMHQQTALARQEELVANRQGQINAINDQLSAAGQTKAAWIEQYKQELSAKSKIELLALWHDTVQQIHDGSTSLNRGSFDSHAAYSAGLQEKLRCIDVVLQQKTFTPEYQQQLTELKDHLVGQREYGKNVISEGRINAIKVTLHEQGALHEANYELSSQARELLESHGVAVDQQYGHIVGNAFEHQLVKEHVSIVNDLAPHADKQEIKEHITATIQFIDAAHEMNTLGNASESCMATDLAHLTSHIAQAVVTTGKVAGAVGKGALEGLFDAVKIPVDMAMHPIETAKGLGHLAVVAKNLVMGDVQTRQKFQDMLTACKQLPFEQKAEHLTRFVVGVLAPGPVALTRSAGFAKGLTALGNAIGKEVATVKAGLNTLAQASRPERAQSVAGTKIIQKLPASVLREAENVAKNKPVVELVKDAGRACADVIFKDGLNFTNKTMMHMNNSNRFVPVQILKDAITSGKKLADPRGTNAFMHYTTMFKDGKMYNLEVLYNKETNTIFHFMYTTDSIGPLAAIKK